MAKLTTPEVMERNLRQSYDEAWYQHIRHQIRFQLGQKYQPTSGSMSPSLSGVIPDDVDIIPTHHEPGQSRRILTNSAIMAQKVCHVTPNPDYPGKSRAKEIVTKAFNQALWEGRPHTGDKTKFEEYGDWGTECEAMFPYGDGLGVGFVQIGIKDNWTTIQHHPLGRVIWDRHRLGVARARYIAFVHILSEEEAVAQFGNDIRKELNDHSAENWASQSLRSIKAIQYCDMGLGEHDPSEIWRLGALGGKVLDVSENKFGCLPFAHMQYLHLPGMRRPEGRISFQIADQQMRNGYERYMRFVLERGPGFDIYDPSGLDTDDLEAMESGEIGAGLKMTLPPMGKIQDRFHRVPAADPPEGLYRGLEYLDRMDPGNSGISEGDRANVTSSARTLGEIENVQEGADTQKQWSKRQYALFLGRLFTKANYIAAKHHKAPTPVVVNGVPMLLNDPGVLQSNLEYWLTPNTPARVNEDNLVKQSPLTVSQIAQAKWLPLVDNPVLGPRLNADEVLKTIIQDGYAEKDVERFILPLGMMPAQPMAPPAGAPGMGPGA